MGGLHDVQSMLSAKETRRPTPSLLPKKKKNGAPQPPMLPLLQVCAPLRPPQICACSAPLARQGCTALGTPLPRPSQDLLHKPQVALLPSTLRRLIASAARTHTRVLPCSQLRSLWATGPRTQPAAPPAALLLLLLLCGAATTWLLNSCHTAA